MSGEQKRAFLVLGAPRSGTSAVSAMLNALGVDFGEPAHFLDKNRYQHNPIFFELREVNMLNDEILRRFSKKWLDSFIPTDDHYAGDQHADMLVRIKQLVRAEFADSTCIGLKDPRLCFTLPLWRRAMEDMGYAIEHVLVVRSASAAVQSNSSLDVTREQWQNWNLWVQCNLLARYFMRDVSYVIANYDAIMADSDDAVSKFVASLDLPQADVAAAHACLNPAHHHFHGSDTSEYPYVDKISRELNTGILDPDEYLRYRDIAVLFQGQDGIQPPVVEPEPSDEAPDAPDSAEPFTEMQVFFPRMREYDELRSSKQSYKTMHQARLTFLFPGGLPDAQLRIDPATCIAVIDISAIIIRRASEGDILWAARRPDQFDAVHIAGTALRCPDMNLLRILSWDEDPQIYIPTLSGSGFDEAIRLEITLRTSTDLSILSDSITKMRNEIVARDHAVAERDQAIAEQGQAIAERDQAIAQQGQAIAKRDQTIAQQGQAIAEKDAIHAQMQQALAEKDQEITNQRRALTAKDRDRAGMQRTIAGKNHAIAEKDRFIHDVRRSLSWRITAPLRYIDAQLKQAAAGPPTSPSAPDPVGPPAYDRSGFVSLGRRPELNIYGSRSNSGRIDECTRAPGKITGRTQVKPGLSVIVLTIDSADLIIPLVEQLLAQQTVFLDKGLQCDIHIGDTGSTDKKVLSFYDAVADRVEIVRGLEYNFSRCNNTLADRARADTLLFLNNDILFKTDTTALFRAYSELHAAPSLGCLGAALHYPDGKIQHAGCEFLKEPSSWGLPYHICYRQNIGTSELPATRECATVTGAFLMIRQPLFMLLGGFDGRYESECQDAALCLEAHRLGYPTVCYNAGHVVHIENATRPKGGENWEDRRRFLRKYGAYIQAAFG